MSRLSPLRRCSSRIADISVSNIIQTKCFSPSNRDSTNRPVQGCTGETLEKIPVQDSACQQWQGTSLGHIKNSMSRNHCRANERADSAQGN